MTLTFGVKSTRGPPRLLSPLAPPRRDGGRSPRRSGRLGRKRGPPRLVAGLVFAEDPAERIGDLADRKDAWLSNTFGKRGPELKARALGIDNEPVVPSRETKSVSSETTFPNDVGDPDYMEGVLRDLSQEVSDRLRKDGLRGRTVSIKLRLANFTTFTRQQTLLATIDDTDDIFRAARVLLRREMNPGPEFRLLGVGVSGFQDFGQLPLFPLEEDGP